MSGANLRELPDDYDLDHLRGALAYLSSFRFAVDGGAHRGIWTAELEKHFTDVVAFEPRRDYAQTILGSCVYDVALGATYGYCSIADGNKNDGQAHIVEGVTHTIRPLDSYCFEDVDFLKLDLEGYELFALHGAKETISTYHPAIMVEQNDLCLRYSYTTDDLERWMVANGYEHTAVFGVDHLWLHREYRRSVQH